MTEINKKVNRIFYIIRNKADKRYLTWMERYIRATNSENGVLRQALRWSKDFNRAYDFSSEKECASWIGKRIEEFESFNNDKKRHLSTEEGREILKAYVLENFEIVKVRLYNKITESKATDVLWSLNNL